MPRFLILKNGLVAIDKIDSILRKKDGDYFIISIMLQSSTFIDSYKTEEARDLEFERIKMILTDSAQ